MKLLSKRHVLATAIAAAPFLLLSATRNGFFEFCTTKAYGYPFPWYVDHCLCAKSALPVNPGYWALNIAIILALGGGLSFVWATLRSRRHGPAHENTMP